MTQGGWSLHSLQSEDLDPAGRLMVRADIVTRGRADRPVEEIIGRISLDPSVSAVSWKILSEEIETAWGNAAGRAAVRLAARRVGEGHAAEGTQESLPEART